MNKTALLVALALACTGALLLFVYLRRFEEETSGGPKVRLLVTVEPLVAGQVLSDDMLATRDIPQAYVEGRAVRESERARVVGLRIATPVQPQQTLLWTDLAIAADDRRDLSSLVQPGMRAVSIHAAAEGTVSLVRPGDRVDVIATTPQANDQRQSMVLLQNVLVLAVGLDLGIDTTRPSGERSDQLTLSVSVAEAQLLELAVDKGRLSVAVRHPDDPRLAEGLTDISSTVLTDPKSRTAVQQFRAGPVQLGAARP